MVHAPGPHLFKPTISPVLFPNLNLLDYPWISLSLCATFECALPLKTLTLETPKQPLVAKSRCGSPQHPHLLKKPFKTS